MIFSCWIWIASFLITGFFFFLFFIPKDLHYRERRSVLGPKSINASKHLVPEGLCVLVQHRHTRTFLHTKWADLLKTWHWKGALMQRQDASIVTT